MDRYPQEAAQHLADIVTRLDPWFRARLSSILVWPTTTRGWAAIMSYAHYTTPQPGEIAPPGITATYPHDTQHAVALDAADVDAAVAAQVRYLEQTGGVGCLTLNRVAAPPWTPGGPPSPGWTIRTHSGSEAERRVWQRRIGQAL